MPPDGDSPPKQAYSGIMKTPADIPDREPEDAIGPTKAKREGAVGAAVDSDPRVRMAELASYAGTCSDLMTLEELQALRRRG